MTRRRSILCVALLLVSVLPVFAQIPVADGAPWKFGIISDTQWSPAEGHAGRGVAIEIIDDVNEEFIKHGVAFVIAVGDVTNNGGTDPSELYIRAQHATALHRAGIGFFPLRGNHEGTLEAARHWTRAFPRLPGLPGFRSAGRYLDADSPDLPGLAGLTYSFTYRNAMCIFLDTFVVDDGSESGRSYPIPEQQPWVTEQLDSAFCGGRHPFIFAHKNLLGQNHKGSVFGDPISDEDPGDQSEEVRRAAAVFYRAMHENGARYFFCGHDHLYHRSIVRSPEVAEAVSIQQIITGSNSHKHYTPEPPYSSNETPLVQQRRAVGYLIVTIDGPRVQADYYAVVMPGEGAITEWQPVGDWPLLDRFGYSLNGEEFLIGPGESLTRVTDRAPAGGGYGGTAMRVLAGVNDRAGVIEEADPADNRSCSSLVATGWSPAPPGALSDCLHLWGMRTSPGSTETSQYVLALSYRPGRTAQDGRIALLSRDDSGRLVNAVALNAGGRPCFVAGPYREGYGLGTYGVDPTQEMAWAVLNHDGEFVVAPQR